MDRKPTENSEIQELIRRSQASRAQLTGSVAILRQRLDVPSRIRTSLKQNPSKWVLGSLVSGLVASLLFRRKPKKKSSKKRGFPLKMVALTLTAARPIAKTWLSGKLKQWVVQAARTNNSPFTIEPSPTNVQAPGPRPR